MKKLTVTGRCIFAAAFIFLGILQFFVKDYIIGRPPSAEWSAGKATWAYISGIMMIILALCIIFKWNPANAAFLLGAMTIIYSFFLRYLPSFIKPGTKAEDIFWSINAYKTLALAGGAFIVAASFTREQGRNLSSVFTNTRLIRTGIILLALFFIMCGAAHFKFAPFVDGLVPDFMPWHRFWTYFAAVALLAGGIGILIPATRNLAAFLSGIMVLLWFFMVHIPRALTLHEYGEWMGVGESFAFSGIFFVLAGVSNKGSLK